MYFDDENKKYVILDVEGNSVSQKVERKITQFSAIVFKNYNKEVINMFNRNVNLINPYVIRMNDISVNKLKNEGMTERHMVKEIYHLLSDADVIYGYGLSFDKDIINYMLVKYGYEPILKGWYDVIDDVKANLRPSKLQLQVASTEYGFCSENFHNALVDCEATLHLMKVIEERSKNHD